MRILFSLLLWLIFSSAHASGNEVRILIDVSGSMKQTDPHNLRIPALKLLLELLSPDSRAGVWLFAEDTETLIAPAMVDSAWKEHASKAAGNIHSRGRLTDIEKAIGAVISDWRQPETDTGRHLILLTDGMVDISGNEVTDAASRTRLLKQLLPDLQALGVHAYTIALSEQADHALLKQLAVATDGWNEIAQTAEQLQRIFLKIFKTAVPRDSVPLQGNAFNIDASINEFSLLVFRTPESPATELIKPSGQRWTYDNHPETVHWHHEEGYDLITASTPMPGRWQVVAEFDPDNQVMIVTDLKLKVDPLPTYLLEPAKLTVYAKLTEHDETITRDNFLRLVNFVLQEDDDTQTRTMLKADPDNPGTYSHDGAIPGVGPHTLTVTADGKTFQRTWQQNVAVISTPVNVEVIQPEKKTDPVILRLVPDTQIIDTHAFQATALVTIDGQTIEIPFTPGQQASFQAQIDRPRPPQSLTVNFDIEAKDLTGQALPVIMKPVIIEPFPTPHAREEMEEESLTEEEEMILEEPPTHHWIQTAGIAAVINLVLAVGGVATWRWLRKRTERQHEALLNRLAG